MFGGGGGSFFGGGDSTPNKYGYKAHAVFTSLKNGSEFLLSETSYTIENDNVGGLGGFGGFFGGGGTNDTSTPLCMNVRLIWNKTDSEIDELYEDDKKNASLHSSGGGCNTGTGALSVITLAGSLLILKRKAI